MKGRLLFLGTGASLGIPLIGCQCAVCHSPDPKNRRLRPSVYVTWMHKNFLIDVGPDFREQALRYHIDNPDVILFTHAHYDHTAGIDDLRPILFNRPQPLPVYLSAETAEEVKMRFHYMFNPAIQPLQGSKIDLRILKGDQGNIDFEGVAIGYCTYTQGGMSINGFRFEHFAYITDIRHYPESIFESLRGVKVLVISAMRYTPAPLHLSIDEAVAFAEKVGAERVWLTHISHDVDYEKGNAYLPPHVRLSYDGLAIEF